MTIANDGWRIRVRSETSAGGWVVFSGDALGQVTIKVESTEDGRPRLDARVDPADLRRVLRIVDALDGAR